MLWWGKLHQIWAGRHLTNLPAWKRWMAKPHRWPSPPSRVPGQIHPTTLRPLLQLQWLILAGASYHLRTVEEDNQFRLCFPAYSHQHCKQMTLPAVFLLANNNHKSLDCSGFFPFSISTKSYLSGFASDRSTTLSLLQRPNKGRRKRMLPPPLAAGPAPSTWSSLSTLASYFHKHGIMLFPEKKRKIKLKKKKNVPSSGGRRTD